MATREKPLCIIPARGGSKRVPRKNIADLRGRPLLAWAIRAARRSGVFDSVCVSSEDDEILQVARDHGADLVHDRSGELATDTAQVKSVCADVLRWRASEGEQYDAFGVLLTTTPLRRPADLAGAWRAFDASDAPVLMSVTPFDPPPQRALALENGRLHPHFGGAFFGPRQELTPLYRHDGTVIYCRTEPFLETGEFYQDDIAAYVIDPEYAVDVDTPLDLEWVRFLAEKRGLGEGEDAG